ncbi:glycosyltransferase family 4 protein, partial [bacterium]|nr:glycosyltransferase family 4 protein [bacterium]
MTASTGKRLRIAVVTPLFPLREEPYRGHPIYQTVLALRDFADLEVFCPMAIYPPWKIFQPRTFQARTVDPTYQPGGVTTHYFEHLTLPVVGRLVNGSTSASRLLPLLERFRPQVILSYWVYPYGYAALKVGRRLGVPVVVGSRGSDLLRIPDRISRMFTVRTLRQADGVLTVTEELRHTAVRLGANEQRVHVVTNGCNTSIFSPGDRIAARSRLGIKSRAKLIVYVGHLFAAKGLRELSAAFTELSPEMPHLELAFIGEGSLRQELDQARLHSGLADRFHLPGPASSTQVADWLRAADLFCLPSYSEGCPNVVLEALACGTPVIGTTVGGIPDLVSETSGVLVPPRDILRLKAAMVQALT